MSPKALKNNAETLRYLSIIDTQRKASHFISERLAFQVNGEYCFCKQFFKKYINSFNIKISLWPQSVY